ncbi:Phage-related protein, tail component [Vreelandella subterranea]|uniref:Phage-related protein, tail component n=1 Tax=Vreelandella subterranea TaxID=416874 RepID=A0A1H9UTS8_9GAMM|nr:tail assembly protein [Halomonas subterranea]SES12729.1 Phage-related protein, tail component [Halomonas subterranea]
MKTVHLHGHLGARFGERFSFDVQTPAEAARALCQLPGFRAAIEAGDWHVIRGPLEDGDDLDEEGLTLGLGKTQEIHIMPVVQGAGDVFNVVAGVALFAAGAFTGNAYLMAAGAGMAIGGVVQMTTSPPGVDYNSRQRPDERPSFLFDGPTNTSTQGAPVPIIYGRIRTGSIVISAGLAAEEV